MSKTYGWTEIKERMRHLQNLNDKIYKNREEIFQFEKENGVTQGVFMRMYVDKMIASRKGKIVNIIPFYGAREYLFRSIYISSQYALLGLTKTLSQELGYYNVEINAICPFLVEDENYDEIYKRLEMFAGLNKEELKLADIAKIPLGRPATPSDIANAVLFLTSEKADYITGQIINVSGGVG